MEWQLFGYILGTLAATTPIADASLLKIGTYNTDNTPNRLLPFL